MRKIILSLVFFLSAFYLFAEYELIIDGDAKITKYPQISLRIQLRNDTIPIKLTQEKIFIIEDNIVSKPIEVSKPDASSFQTIRWNFSSNALVFPTIVVIDSSVVYRRVNIGGILTDDDLSYSLIKFVDNRQNIIKELRFGNVLSGNYTNKGGDIIVANNRINNITSIPIRIDSIHTSSPDFKYLWLGSNINTNQPPVDIISPFPYSFEIIFFPTESKYYREYFTIFYDGGRKQSIALVGNSYPLPRRTHLQLLSPNTEENLYPCQKYLIQWQGNNPATPVNIDYTTNQGKNWIPITKTFGNSYLWTIPNVETDSLLVRIYQEYLPPGQLGIGNGNHIPNKIAFSVDSNFVAIANEDGLVEIYEVTENKLLFSLPFSKPDYPNFRVEVSHIDLIEHDQKILLAYRFVDLFQQEYPDTIALLDIVKREIVTKFKLPQSKGKLKNLIIDRKNNKFYLLPYLSNSLLCYNLNNGAYINEIKFEFPILNGIISHTGKFFVFATLNKDIRVFNSQDFTLHSIINLVPLPLVSKLAISPDDRLVGFTTLPPTGNNEYGNLSDAYVCDISTGIIVRSLYNNWSDAIGLDFSPASNYLILAFENNPILIFWDIVNDIISSSIVGSSFKISDFKLSPSSFTIATSEPSLKRVILRNFNYPEMDLSDSPSKIKKPKISSKEFTLPPQPIFYSKDYTIVGNFCNVGEVPLVISNSFMLKNRNFHLPKSLVNDTLYPGKCYEIIVNFNPIDTGIVTDSLIIESCGNYYFLPLFGIGLNRNLKFLVEKIDFGNVCINESKEIELEAAINLDSLTLPINKILLSNSLDFQIIDGSNSQILNPNDKLKLKLIFTPRKTGLISDYIEIYYLDQKQYVFRLPIQGSGFGTDLIVSTNDLRFIPEITARQITITNPSSNDVLIDSIRFTPPDFFVVNKTFPILIPPNTAKIFEIQNSGQSITETHMEIFASPCAVLKSVQIGPYLGSSYIWIDTIESEPKGTITIRVHYQNEENSSYNGIRPFEGTIKINSGIFLPTEITSDFGSSRLLSQEIIGNNRYISFLVNGNFPKNGILAEIMGYVGLPETDTSIIDFSLSSRFWGSSVETQTSPGLIKLTGLCSSRRLQSDSTGVKIISISPNPIKNSLFVKYYITDIDNVHFKLFDLKGNLVFETINLPTALGENIIELFASNLQPGIYRLIIATQINFDQIDFVKIQ